MGTLTCGGGALHLRQWSKASGIHAPHAEQIQWVGEAISSLQLGQDRVPRKNSNFLQIVAKIQGQLPALASSAMELIHATGVSAKILSLYLLL